MPILKKSDIAAKGILDEYIKKVKEATAETKKLQEQVRSVNKTGTGSEAEKRITLANKLTTSTKKLKNALTDEERVKQQILRANAKLSESRTRSAKDLALVRQKTQQQNKALREQAKAQLGVRKGISSLTKQMFAGLGIIAGFRALGSVLTNALKIYKEFEKESSRLAAIVGKNKDEIKALTEQAKLLGSTTAFTAKQVIELQIELGKLGFSLKEIEASTPGILALAAATGTELASAAELAGATLRIFNLDASQMSRVTDVLALSTTKSSLSMEKLAVILPIVGKTAQIAGLSLEQTAALAGTLTDRGLDASSAATSLRNIFLELSKKGITWNEAMIKINSSTDKNKTSMDLFGKRAASAGVVLSETAESTDELTEALNNADGAAKRMADTMLNNLAGDITKAESAWEGFINSLITGEGVISKVARGLTQFFSTLVGELTQLNNGASIALIQLKNVQNFEEKLSDFRTKNVKLLKEITNEEDKKLKLEGRAAILGGELLVLERKLKREKEGNLEISKDEKTQMEFRRDLLKGQIQILNSLIPLEKSNNIAIETNATANKKATEELKARIIKEKELISSLGADRVTQKGEENSKILGLEEQVLKEQAILRDTARKEELEKIQMQADAELLIKQQLETSVVQLASDIFSSFQDERLAKINSDAEAQKAILQQRLDDGVISEKQFASQVAVIEKKARIESAKAEKKKAIFDIAIATLVASIKALPNVILSAAILVIGGIQAAAVAAKPIPKFEKGGKNVVKSGKIEGKSHKQGGVLIETEGNEFIVQKDFAPGADNILNAVNAGMLTDRNFNMMSKQDADMLIATLLMSGNKTSEQLLTAMLNGVSTYDRDGVRYILKPNGGIEKFNV